MFSSEIGKISVFFLSENVQFLEVKISIYLNRHVQFLEVKISIYLNRRVSVMIPFQCWLYRK